MKQKKRRTLRERIAEARARLADRIESESGINAVELQALVDHLDLLEEIERRRWRRRSLAWVVVAVAIAVVAAVALRSISLRRAEIVLAANAKAFSVTTGRSRLRLVTAVRAREISMFTPASTFTWRMETMPAASNSADLFRSANVNAVYLNPEASAQVLESGSCFEVVLFDGTGQAIVSAMPRDAGAAARPHARIESVELSRGDSIRFCPESDAAIRLPRAQPGEGLASITVAEREGSASEQQYLPSLLQGTLKIANVARSIDLRRTDVLRIGGLTTSVLVARLQHPMEITTVGTATMLGLGTESGEQSLMPNCLDWVRSNPLFRGAVTVLAAIIAGAYALRAKLLGEI